MAIANREDEHRGSTLLEHLIASFAPQLPDRFSQHGVDAETGQTALRLILDLIQDPVPPDFSSRPLSQLVLVGYLVREIRSVLLRSCDSDADCALEAIAILRRLETIERAATEDSDADGATALLSSLRGPELLVEIAHDLRSPLTSILFLSETLRDGHSGELNPHQKRQLGIIYSAALSLSALAGDVIELVQRGRSLIEREPVEFSVRHIFDSIADLVRPMLEDRDVTLREGWVGSDLRVGRPAALSRVLLNLITNAIKNTERGFIELQASEHQDGVVEFSVRDTGSGIPPEALQHLFDPFRSARIAGSIGFSGSGLGLSICKRLLQGMGSELNLETSPEWGSRFFFAVHLPKAAPKPAPDEAVP